MPGINVFFSVKFSLLFSKESYIKCCGFIPYRFLLVGIIWIIRSMGQASRCGPICHRNHKLWLNQFTTCSLRQVHTLHLRSKRKLDWQNDGPSVYDTYANVIKAIEFFFILIQAEVTLFLNIASPRELNHLLVCVGESILCWGLVICNYSSRMQLNACKLWSLQ
jgi:hypothetical protein